jgi:glycosyltransferase involved in cell wall biosynthesis
VRRIVSVAPTWIEADSRTLKAAVSFARAGYRSVVVEGGKSTLADLQETFSLRSMGVASDPTIRDREEPASSVPRQVGGEARRTRGHAERVGGSLVGAIGQATRRTAVRLLRPIVLSYRILRNSLWKPFFCSPPASLYYLHAPYQFPGVYLRSKMHGAPFIYDAHDFYSAHEPGVGTETFLQSLLLRYHHWLESACVKRAAAVVTVGGGVADLISAEFGRQSLVVRNCHDSRLDRKLEVGIRERLGLSDRDFLLISVGHAKAGVAIEEAVAALRGLPSYVHLVFLGWGHGRRLSGVSDVDGRLHIVAPVKPWEVVPFIRSADAGLLLYYPLDPNYRNSLPNRFFQSVAAELPLLYPPLPEIRKLAEEFDLGIAIDPSDPESIKEGTLAFLQNKERYAAVKANLRSVKDILSWEQEERLLLDLVGSVLAEKG